MDINSKFEVSVWGVLCLIGVTAVTVSGATWGVSKMTEANELQAYRSAKDWKASDTIASLQELSRSVKLDADERAEILSLRRRVPELEKAVEDIGSQFKQTKEEASSLRDTLASLVKNIEQIEIPLRESRYVIPKTLTVGVHSIYTSSNRCGIRVGDRSESIEVGQPFEQSFSGKQYVITLLKISDAACTFAFSEKPKS
jgi:septal ring factor EnvC (AmiA/AmiB activator)